MDVKDFKLDLSEFEKMDFANSDNDDIEKISKEVNYNLCRPKQRAYIYGLLRQLDLELEDFDIEGKEALKLMSTIEAGELIDRLKEEKSLLSPEDIDHSAYVDTWDLDFIEKNKDEDGGVNLKW